MTMMKMKVLMIDKESEQWQDHYVERLARDAQRLLEWEERVDDNDSMDSKEIA